MPTGIALGLPPGVAALTLPRSGLAARNGITMLNAPGLIDPGYRGEIQIVLFNTDHGAEFAVQAGDRIAQLLVVGLLDVASSRSTGSTTRRAARAASARRARPRNGGLREATTAVPTTPQQPRPGGAAERLRVAAARTGAAARQWPARPTVRVAALIITAEGLLLVRQRAARAVLAAARRRCGFGESIAEALRRELREELDLAIVPGRPLALAEAISDDMARYPKHVVHVICEARLADPAARACRGDAGRARSAVRRPRDARRARSAAAGRAVSAALLRRAAARRGVSRRRLVAHGASSGSSRRHHRCAAGSLTARYCLRRRHEQTRSAAHHRPRAVKQLCERACSCAR